MVAVDHPRRLFGDSPLQRIPEELGLAKNILTVRLRALIDHGILTTAPASDGSAYQEYVLTPKGRGLFPILVALAAVERGVFRRDQGFPDPAGRPRPRPAGSKLELRAEDGRVLGQADTELKANPKVSRSRRLSA